jgi:hypothetical protein
MSDETGLRVVERDGVWLLTGEDIGRFVVKEFLGYLAVRNYSPRTRCSYAFDLLHFTR